MSASAMAIALAGGVLMGAGASLLLLFTGRLAGVGRIVAGLLQPSPEWGWRLDRTLLVGSALFGVGWGLSGYCPGPVLASLVAGGPSALVFIAGMFAGMAAYGLLYRERRASSSLEPRT
jgi:uncharacterized membrane protein YedE/YeeE